MGLNSMATCLPTCTQYLSGTGGYVAHKNHHLSFTYLYCLSTPCLVLQAHPSRTTVSQVTSVSIIFGVDQQRPYSMARFLPQTILAAGVSCQGRHVGPMPLEPRFNLHELIRPSSGWNSDPNLPPRKRWIHFEARTTRHTYLPCRCNLANLQMKKRVQTLS